MRHSGTATYWICAKLDLRHSGMRHSGLRHSGTEPFRLLCHPKSSCDDDTCSFLLLDNDPDLMHFNHKVDVTIAYI